MDDPGVARSFVLEDTVSLWGQISGRDPIIIPDPPDHDHEKDALTPTEAHGSHAPANKRGGNFLWILTALGSVLGALVAIVGVLAATGAPQEAAAAAVGIACAVIPYCLARAASEIRGS